MVELTECSGECSLSSSASGSSPRFSIFKWFKRSPKTARNTNPKIPIESAFSSNESVDTFYSTATVRSFAFQPGAEEILSRPINLSLQKATKVGPFGDGAVKILENNLGTNVTRTLPPNVRGRDITARYSLQPYTASFGSCGNIGQKASTRRDERTLTHERNIRRVHVRGKRRAPNPPKDLARPRSFCEGTTGSRGQARRKRRPAPKPPEVNKWDTGMERKAEKNCNPFLKVEDLNERKVQNQISTDTLVLRGGVLLPKSEPQLKSGETSELIKSDPRATVLAQQMPRPWYKRNVFEASATGQAEVRSSENEGSLRHFFTRSDRTRDKKREAKRQSGMSILTNISELDKEAAAIVQEEQAKSRAAMLLESSRLCEIERRSNGTESVVQDMVTSAMENSPRRGTRALISKFNAIGNITKVTVNTNFFARRDAMKVETDERWRERGPRVEKDLSKYFDPVVASERHPKSNGRLNETRRAIDASRLSFLEGTLGAKPQNLRNAGSAKQGMNAEDKDIITNVTNRLSALQDIIKNHSSPTPKRASRALQSDENARSFSNSPQLSSRRTEQRDTRTEKFDGVKTSAEVIQREFSEIFEEIDRQLSASKLRIERRRLEGGVKKEESNVTKVLDMLVEAERKQQEPNQVDKEKVSAEANSDKVDLKEMLKEMKHSLPKRPKPGRPEDPRSIPSTSKLLNPVKITAPPVLQIAKGPPTKVEPKGQKVSSGVQTSGNIRQVDVARGEKSGLDVQGANVRKTFHLMRPREFAAIEAIMTMKHKKEENTYANVVEQSIYANAMVLPSRNRRSNEDSEGKADVTRAGTSMKIFDDTGGAESYAMASNMNTLAVNRQLKQLEGAIASGNYLEAAGLAKVLAKNKIQCSVIRQRPKGTNVLNVDMFIEDRLAHQGPIPLSLPMTMSVGQLKEKISKEFQIPPNVQRWIIAEKLARDDEATLHELNAREGIPIFLYLAAPVLQINQVDGNAAPNSDNMEEVKEGLNGPVSEESSDEEELPDPLIDEVETNDVTNVDSAEIGDENEDIEDTTTAVQGKAVVENEVEKVEEIENIPIDDEGAVGITEPDRMEYQELLMLDGSGFVSNVDSFECPICFLIYAPLEGVILRECLHSFCRGCLEKTIKYCTEAEVKCPYMNADYTCESTLQEREIKALVPADVYEQHLKKSISQAENNAGKHAFHCKTPNCNGWCIIDDDVNHFLCPVCDLTNCLLCRVIHNGKNCWEYQEDIQLSTDVNLQSERTAEKLRDMLASGEAMNCPICGIVITKKMGCDALTCSMCKTDICWITRGPRWGPNGKGDTSGGCRCGLNGVRCHPNCKNCH